MCMCVLVSARDDLALRVTALRWKQQVNIVTPPAAAPRSTAAHFEKNGSYFLPERAPLPVSACRSFQCRCGSLESFHRSCKSVEILEWNYLGRESVDHSETGTKETVSFLVERWRGYSWVHSLLTLNSQLWLVGQSYHNWTLFWVEEQRTESTGGVFCFYLLLIGWLNIK